jgi:hypothetical protein
MKKLTILLFSILISFNSYGEWTEAYVGKYTGNVTYLDLSTIKKHSDHVYWWQLNDLAKPLRSGGMTPSMSAKVYFEGDCGISRYKRLSYVFYNQSMGKGKGDFFDPSNPEWSHPPPGSLLEGILKYACNYVK